MKGWFFLVCSQNLQEKLGVWLGITRCIKKLISLGIF